MSPRRGAPPRNARSRADALPRVAVVGLGIGRSHVVGLLQPPALAEVCALCDHNRSRLRRVGEEFGVAARYADFEEMLEKEKPDAVVVATPNDLHAPVAVAALEAGAHVLCEKPLAHRLDAAREIAEAAGKRRRFVMLDLSFRFTGGARTAKRFLESGRCGDLYHSSTYWARTRGIPTWAQWFFTAARSGGGPVIDLGVHRIDLALWFLGEPAVERVAAFAHGRLGRRLVGAKYDVEEFGGGILRCAGGASVVFETSWAENSGRREVMLTRTLGVRGGAVHRNLDHTYEFVAELYEDRRGELVEVDAKRFVLPALVPAREFVRAMLGGAPAQAGLPDVATGVALSEILAAIYLSAREGREVALAEVRSSRARRPG
jgi:predicted dehydrogenase